MTVKASYLTPILQVTDIQRSIRFYSLLGFETIDVEQSDGSIVWARVHCEGGALMFVPGEQPHDRHEDRIPFYLYTPDLPALCRQLAAADLEVGPISHPHYMRSGEICLKDPDGYTVLIGHWGEQEHQAWQQQREKKRAAGLIP